MPTRAAEHTTSPDGGNRLLTAAGVSALGDGVRMTALPLLAVTYTNNPALISLLTAAGTIPTLLSPLAGAAADRWPCRALMIRVDLLRAVLVGLLALAVFTNVANLALLCVVAFVLGLGEVLFVITAQSFLPEVVPTARLASVNGRLQAVQLVFQDSVGQPLGGLLFAVALALPFVVDGISFVLGVLLLATVRLLVAEEPTADNSARPRWSEMIRAGFEYLRGDRLLFLLAFMLGIINFWIVGVSAVFVLYVLHVLGLNKIAYGFFLALGAIGGLLGGIAAGWLRDHFGLFPTVVGALVLDGLSCLLMGLVHETVTAAVGFFVLNIGGVVYQALTVTFRQTSVDKGMLGRVNGVYRLIGTGPAALGAIAAGGLADGLGIAAPFWLAGIALLLLAALTGGPLLRMGAAADPGPRK